QAVQTAARPARPHLPAVPRDADAVGDRRRDGVDHRRAPAFGLRHLDAAAQAPGGRRARAARALRRRRAPRARQAHCPGPQAARARGVRAATGVHRQRLLDGRAARADPAIAEPARHAPGLTALIPSPTLNTSHQGTTMALDKVLYTARATSTGGRTGS